MIVTGIVYPGLITGLGRVLFPHQSGGSLIEVDGRVVGSELIGQTFTQPYYFHSRPSSAGSGYDASASAGSNLGPTSQKLDSLIADGVTRAVSQEGADGKRVPADYVTRSASGLDPHISPANAEIQIARVASARGVSDQRVRNLVLEHTEGRQFGFLGEPRINVLRLNTALDRSLPR